MNPRLLTNRDKRKKVEIEVPIPCDTCEQYINKKCEEHNAEVEELSFIIRPITWMKQHDIRANSYVLNAQTQNVQFSMSSYIESCLEEMIVDAPWTEPIGIFLAQVGPELGTALESLVPPLGGIDGDNQQENVDKIKKAQN